MILLKEVDENNLSKLIGLHVEEHQKQYVPSAEGILARAWAYRNKNAMLYALAIEDHYVGLALIHDVDEEPSCHYLMELMIDYRDQGKGYGQLAVMELIKTCKERQKYPRMEASVDRSNAAAIHTFKKAGFVDSFYTDPNLPQYINLVYTFEEIS